MPLVIDRQAVCRRDDQTTLPMMLDLEAASGADFDDGCGAFICGACLHYYCGMIHRIISPQIYSARSRRARFICGAHVFVFRSLFRRGRQAS